MALMIHKTKITLYNSKFDTNEKLTAKAILEIFQDVAGIHAEEIGVGYVAMLEKNLYWVLSRVKFDILTMPQPNQEVIVETWPHEKGRIDFDRDFKVSSLDGEVLIIGTSKWCVINTETRSLERTDNVVYNGECCLDVNYHDRFLKINLPQTELKSVFEYSVTFSDLDHNKHMNNTNYANLVANAAENKDFSHFEINFLNECLIGDILNVSVTTSQDGEYITGTTNNKTAFIAFIK